MKHLNHKLATLIGIALLASASAIASEAETSASATGRRGRSGNATATARYVGDLGFARTDTRTGRVNVARGVAVGLDEDGLAVSISTAIAPGRGPAIGANFNLSIAANGQVAHSTGRSLATGGRSRTVTVGGGCSANRFGSSATSLARGSTRGGGTVKAHTTSRHQRTRHIVRRSAHRRIRTR